MNTKTLKPVHRILVIAMAAVVALCFIPFQMAANHAYAEYGTWTWTFDDGTTLTYIGDGSDLEDCDANDYDDHIGYPVPWPGFDGTRDNKIPSGWDGVTRDYEYYFPYTPGPSGGGSGNGGGNGNGSGNGNGDGVNPGTNPIDKTTADGGTTDTESVLVKAFDKTPKPKITGKAKVGKKLKVKVGTWSPKPNFTYQWYANGKAIKGATKASLKLKKAQKGKKITVKVTAKKAGFLTEKKTSKKTAKVK
jgi:hypothetical protein